MMNYAWDFSQSETEKYFEWIIFHNIVSGRFLAWVRSDSLVGWWRQQSLLTGHAPELTSVTQVLTLPGMQQSLAFVESPQHFWWVCSSRWMLETYRWEISMLKWIIFWCRLWCWPFLAHLWKPWLISMLDRSIENSGWQKDQFITISNAFSL